jgi:adenylosuccinate lyase
MHEQLRDHAMLAWQAVQQGQPNPLTAKIMEDSTFQGYLSTDQIRSILQVEGYTGIATERALDTVDRINQLVKPAQ